MPRRPPEVITKIPRFLVEGLAIRELRKAGESLVKLVIKEMKGHCFSISVHTRVMCRRVFPYKPRLTITDTEPGLFGGYVGVADP